MAFLNPKAVRALIEETENFPPFGYLNSRSGVDLSCGLMTNDIITIKLVDIQFSKVSGYEQS